MFYFDKINGKNILKSDFLENIPHFFTTRETVIKSKDPTFDNLVKENRKDICQYLNIDEKNLISPSQTHSANIAKVQANKFSYSETDGLILTQKNIAIALNFADCTPIILFDKKQNIGAISHAGWRGTAQKISALTVKKMVQEYNSKPKNIIAVIGPAISKCCYNVGEDVMLKLSETVASHKNLFEKRNGEIFVDLKGINRQQLIEVGVNNIDICPYCTVCDNDKFFSYRKENATTCRHSAVLMLKVAES